MFHDKDNNAHYEKRRFFCVSFRHIYSKTKIFIKGMHFSVGGEDPEPKTNCQRNDIIGLQC